MKNLTEQDVLQAIRREVEASGLRKMAEKTGVNAGNLSQILKGERAVSESVAEAFGFERVTTISFRKRIAA